MHHEKILCSDVCIANMVTQFNFEVCEFIFITYYVHIIYNCGFQSLHAFFSWGAGIRKTKLNCNLTTTPDYNDITKHHVLCLMGNIV